MNRQDLSILWQLKSSPLGEAYLKILRARLDDRTRKCRHYDGNALYRIQGAAVALEELLDEIESAHTNLQRLPPERAA